MAVGKVSDADFEAEVLKATGPVVVDFWAEWCGPCRMIGPALDEISGQDRQAERRREPEDGLEIRRDVDPDLDDLQGRRNGLAPGWRSTKAEAAAVDYGRGLISAINNLP
jgi:thiol-disulfide isomerase/thioredoxin